MSGLPQAEPLADGVVLLRRWTEADAPELAACIDGDEEIARWLDQIPQPYTVEDALTFIGIATSGKGDDLFAVTDAASGRLLGSAGSRWDEPRHAAEIGYWLRADARGTGVITRAVRLATDYAFAEGAARVWLRVAVGNESSRRVAERIGFRPEGVLRSAHWNERLGRRVDWAIYSLLPGELE
jgi:RimJ/RimL family protein N-acetyltransferase